SSNYAISGYLARILSPVVGNTDYTVKNSCEFTDFIRDKTLDASEELVSFDVVSLFTKIPVDLAVKGNLETSVYRKPTHTDKYLAFDSHHPICHKKSVAKTLLRRADCLPSSLDSKAEERKYVSNVLKANGYIKTFLRNCQKPVTNSNALDEREPATGFAVIPYIQGVTEPIKRILNSHNVKVAQKPFQTLGHIFAKPKDPVTKEQRTDAIYSIPCNDCDNEYIGQTKRQFGTRLKEHQKRFFFAKGKFSFIGAYLPNQPYNWVG
ncbi:unnamed protein product, partial [Pocillopora meandrina]